MDTSTVIAIFVGQLIGGSLALLIIKLVFDADHRRKYQRFCRHLDELEKRFNKE